MKETIVTTNSREETVALGERLGTLCMPSMVFLLDGDLGAGKTTLTQGIAKGLHIKRNVTSPTFNILKIYHGDLTLYHIDAYRLEGVSQDLGFDEFLDDDGVTIIEWSQYVPELIPNEYMKISIRLNEDFSRSLHFEAFGSRYESVLEDLQ